MTAQKSFLLPFGCAVLLLTLAGQAADIHSGVPDGHRPGGPPVPGHGDPGPGGGIRVVELDDVPESPFRDRLIELEPGVLGRVLESLGQLGFRSADAHSLRVDPDGALSFFCRCHAEAAQGTANAPAAAPSGGEAAAEPAAEPGVANTGAVPVSAPPVRHSRPGSEKILFLDFNGHIVTNTRWNSIFHGSFPFANRLAWDCRPYSLDADEATFSTTEQQNIIRIWERVAEDYAPFDVDVTTEQPTSWNRHTGHALITPGTDRNGNRCPNYNLSGLAHATPAGTNFYLGVFGHPDYSYDVANCYSPAWINPNIGTGGTRRSAGDIAEIVSHELGHNMGLGHDDSASDGVTYTYGRQDFSYFPGHDTGPITWAPIMGVPYGKNVTQWSKGEYRGSQIDPNTLQQDPDDLAIIADKLAYRQDDYGDTEEEATVLTVSPSGRFIRQGVIETADDTDVFAFRTEEGSVYVFALPYRDHSDWGGNLDILLELRDSAGTLLASVNPERAANAIFWTNLLGGVYHLHVKPTGVGDPFADPASGYTVYGSIGQYTLGGSVEADADSDGLPDEWERTYFGSPSTVTSTADADGDGQDNLSEYIAGTDPTNHASRFAITGVVPLDGGFEVRWDAVESRVYTVLRTRSLANDFEAVADLPYPQDRYRTDLPAATIPTRSATPPPLRTSGDTPVLLPPLPTAAHGVPQTSGASPLPAGGAFYRVEVRIR